METGLKAEFATAFTNTFAFFRFATNHTKNAKELVSKRTGQRIDNIVNLTQQTIDRRRAACNSGFAKKAGSVVN